MTGSNNILRYDSTRTINAGSSVYQIPDIAFNDSRYLS